MSNDFPSCLSILKVPLKRQRTKVCARARARVCVCVWLTTCTRQETVVRRDCCTERQDSWGTALAPEERETCYNLQTYTVRLHLH